MDDEHLQANREHWNESAGLHKVSYDTDRLTSDPTALSSVVARDARLLAPFLPDGSVAGLDLVHLQCHIGTDTLSWARLGANVTGLDMSPEALAIARELSAAAGVKVEYVQSTIADAADALAGRTFDVVYTSIGVLCWLDDLDQWARLIAGLLRPGGVFYLREGHPMVQAMDCEAPAGELRLGWPYFNCGPQLDEGCQDYSSPVPLQHVRTYEWAHPLSEVIGSLLHAGLTLVDFQEQRDVPWRQLDWMVPDDAVDGFVLPPAQRDLCPLTYSLVAVAPTS